jgi:integrase
MILADIGRERMAKALKLPRRGEPRVVVYDENDVAEMENSCRLLRDRLLIKIALETGARRGELYNMRIKDVQFDQYSAKIWLHGKTGTRVRRVWRATEDLVSYLREHPEHGNPDAKFWVRHTFHFRNQASGRFTGPKNRPEIHLTSKPLTANSLYRIVRTAGLRSLNRRTFLHGFRHTAATADALKYTDREMMLRFGWSSPAMVGTYAHISARDVDTKELAFHGLRSGGQPNRCCENCKSQNSDAAKFCQNCGRALSGRFS